MLIPFGMTRNRSADVPLRTFGDGDELRDPSQDPFLHRQKRIPASHLHPAEPVFRRRELRIPVHRDRVVDRGHRRIAARSDAEQAIGEALVVVDDVVSVSAPPQMAVGAESEGQGFRESSATHAQEFKLIERRGEIPDAGHLKKMFRVVEIQAGNFVESNPAIEFRIGGARKNIDFVPELPERAAQILDVNPLPPAGGIPAVGEQTDLQGSHPGESRGPVLSVSRLPPGRGFSPVLLTALLVCLCQ